MRRAESTRLIAVGDLNGAYDVLVDILQATALVNRKLEWTGGHDEFVQMGDLFNRGGGAVRALRLLLRLQRQAQRAGGRVTVLLGNHEVMTALRHEGYCTEQEYLSFASVSERKAWPARVERAMLRLIRQRPEGVIEPIEPRLEAWKATHAPGRTALRRALGARAPLGRALRGLPVAYLSRQILFVHGGLVPEWAQLGIDGLNRRAREAWAAARGGLWTLPKTSLFRSSDGPLWNRSLAYGGRTALRALQKTLRLLDARKMVVGHTPTSLLRGGQAGHVQVLHQGRLIAVDVGLESGATTARAALVLDGPRGYEWTPSGMRLLWNDRNAPARRG